VIIFTKSEARMPGWAVALRFTGLGWYIVVCIVGGTAAGIALDRWLGTKPVFVLVGLVFGLVVAAFGAYRMLTPILAHSRTSTKRRDR